jgi:hypothetical protein
MFRVYVNHLIIVIRIYLHNGENLIEDFEIVAFEQIPPFSGLIHRVPHPDIVFAV